MLFSMAESLTPVPLALRTASDPHFHHLTFFSQII